MRGHVRYDLHKLRTAVMQAQDTLPGYADDADLILRVQPGDHVEAGEELLSIRCPEVVRRTFEPALRSAFTIDVTPIGTPLVAMDCVHV